MAFIKQGKGKVTSVTTKDKDGTDVVITADKDGKRKKVAVKDIQK